MRDADKKIAETLARFNEAFDETNVWRVQNQAVIYHKTIERIAAMAGIQFDMPTVLRAERDEAVILVRGEMKDGSGGTRSDWTIGEAVINVNYRVSGRQAAYVYAIAEKRARDRLVLKLIGLHGLLYSEEEADDFGKSPPQVSDDARPNGAEPPAGPVKSSRQAKKDGDWAQIEAGIAGCKDTATLLEWAVLAQPPLRRLSAAWQEQAMEAWRTALTEKMADELRSVDHFNQWAVDHDKAIAALPPDWLPAMREVWKASLKDLKLYLAELAEMEPEDAHV